MSRLKKMLRVMIPLGLAIVWLSGCSLWKGDRTATEIDPPPPGTYQESDLIAKPVMAESSRTMMPLTVYYEDPHGFVAPITISVPETNAVARTALEYMVEGGPGEALVPEGFRALIPQGTEVLGINVLEDGTAIVDFSEHFAHYNLPDERKIVEAVTWTLTQFDNIDRVLLWLEGDRLDEMPVDGTPLNVPLNRAMGINLERASGVHFGSFTPVTLYFQSQTADHSTYLVPVTRLIPRTDDVMMATLDELIEGPRHAALFSVLMPTVEVLDARQQENMIQVDFNEELLNADHEVADESMQAIVLSLTETTGAEQVQISVLGSAEVAAASGAGFNQPVERPAHINVWKW